jgi:acyl dehydratase
VKYEEFVEGTEYESDERVVSLGEMLAFAELYDRQAIHVGASAQRPVADGPVADRPAADRCAPVIASGYLGLAVTWQLWLDIGVFGEDAVAGVALEHARWVRPMEPGVRVRARVRVTRTWVSSKGKGMVQLQLHLVDGADELLSFETVAVMARRADG